MHGLLPITSVCTLAAMYTQALESDVSGVTTRTSTLEGQQGQVAAAVQERLHALSSQQVCTYVWEWVVAGG